MKILDVDGFQKGITEIEETLSSQKKQVKQIEKTIQGVTDLEEAIKGKGGNAIRDFYRSKHLPLIEQYQTFLSDYQSVIKQMNDALQNLEPAPDGFMNEGFLENELEAGLRLAKQTTEQLTSDANNTIRSVSDIVTLPKIEDENCVQYVVKAEKEIDQSIEKLYEFDHAQTASLSSLQGQVDALEKHIMQLSPVFKKMDFNPVLLPTKEFKSKKVEDIASELSEFKINPHNPADSAAILEGGLLALTDIVIDLVDTLYYMVSDPFGFAQGMFNAVIHLDETIKYLWNDVKQSFEEEFIHGDQRSRVRFISYSGVYIAASIYGVKGTEKVGTVSKAGRISNASKKGTKQNIPYNVMNTTAIKAAAHDGIKNFFDLSKDANRQLHSSEIGKKAKEVNTYSGKINDTIGKSKNVLNSEKFSTKMEKTYQKVVSGPVSKAVNLEAYSTFEKLVMNENGSVRFTGISGDSKIGTKGTVKDSIIKEIKEIDFGKHIIKGKNGKKQLLPNAKYVTKDDYKYTTDELGRIVNVEAPELILKKADRNKYAQANVGDKDRLSDDDGGHLIGAQFNGPADIDNLVPQNSQINRRGGVWYNMETEWANALKEVPPKKVSVNIKPIYSSNSMRPDSFTIKYQIEGQRKVRLVIQNKSGG
ncbi:hypothetical protein D5E69_04680 [Rossellomorea marisflavi]|uniref:T7SS effector LXG polymorphic toxin n=1 Tax=Rossellomorea marisflavi TaxID=189381 RepID=UPI0013161FB0|nr:T7SS effector LXG polymorphic toxin [Rossellomorea marisflavi]QHA35179.1 hypothetical protein D5E69_04680 [Rossellomorea marisflavi]